MSNLYELTGKYLQVQAHLEAGHDRGRAAGVSRRADKRRGLA